MRYLSNGVLVSCLLAGGACFSGLAPAAGQAETATEAATAAPITIEEIVVSARRRNESLHDTPVAISAISASQLEDKASTNIGDLQGAVPNLLITQQNSGSSAANLSIRGLTFADIEKSFDPTVGVVIDGIFIGTSTGQLLDSFDMAKIEVLRGPQGTLFGRNTIGGVINLTRTRPTGEFGGKFEIDYGKFNSLGYRGIINVPVVKDLLAAKFWYYNNSTDGYYTNAITGKPDGGSINRSFGVALLLTPENTKFDALLTLERQLQAFDVTNANLAKTGELFCLFEPANQCNRGYGGDLYTVFTQPARSDYNAPAATLEMNWDLDVVKLTSVTGYRKSDESQTQDFDSSSADLYYTNRVQPYHQFSQELRGAGKITDGLDYVAGLYYYDSAYTLNQATRLGFYTFLGAPAVNTTQIVSGASKSSAVFADFNWAFADQWRLNFGGRYTRDKKSLDNTDGGLFLGAPSATFSKATPKVGIDYRPTNDYLFYTSYSVGYRSGGFSNRAATAFSTNAPFQPETVDTTEIGAKLDFLERRLSVNSAVFYSKYKNLQQNTTISGGATGNQTIVSNVGSASIKGVEIEVIGRPTSYLTLNASLGTLSSKFDGFITTAPNAAGVLQPYDYSRNDLIYNPAITANAGADLKIPVSNGDLHANIGVRHIASYDQQISLGPTTVAPDASSPTGTIIIVDGNDPRVHSPAQNLLDASITREFDLADHTKWRMTIYGRNLTNDLGPSAAFTVAGLWSFASAREPRTFGGKIGFEF